MVGVAYARPVRGTINAVQSAIKQLLGPMSLQVGRIETHIHRWTVWALNLYLHYDTWGPFVGVLVIRVIVYLSRLRGSVVMESLIYVV